jgi:hypothetical protein
MSVNDLLPNHVFSCFCRLVLVNPAFQRSLVIVRDRILTSRADTNDRDRLGRIDI